MSDLIKSNGSELAEAKNYGFMGIANTIEPDDLKNPTLYIVQKNSNKEFHEHGLGSVVENLSMRRIISLGGMVHMVPCVLKKNWLIKDVKADQLIKIIPANNSYEMEREGIEDGRQVKRIFSYTFSGLVSVDGKPISTLPVLIHFGSTMADVARVILNNITEMASKGKPSWSQAVKLTTFEKKGRNGHEWISWKIAGWREATEQEQKDAKKWAERLIMGEDVNG